MIIASRNGYFDQVRYLVKKGANMDMQTTKVTYYDPMLYSFYRYNNHNNDMKLIKDRWSAIPIALENGHDEIVQYLIDKGANVDLQTQVILHVSYIGRNLHTCTLDEMI